MLMQLVLLAMLPAESASVAHPGELRGTEMEDNVPQVFVPSVKERRTCPRPGAVCLSPGGAGTSEGTELRAGRKAVTVLARGAQVAAVGAAHVVDVNQPWDVRLVATFARPASDAPIIVAVLDGEDPVALAEHDALAIWDVSRNPGGMLGLRFVLSPEQGFQPSHDYRVRIVQTQGRAQRILAEGEFHLE